MAAECWIMTQNISMSSKVPIKARIHQAIKLLVLQYNARFNSRLACKTGCDPSEQSSVVGARVKHCSCKGSERSHVPVYKTRPRWGAASQRTSGRPCMSSRRTTPRTRLISLPSSPSTHTLEPSTCVWNIDE
jgi:hypothetical protein